MCSILAECLHINYQQPGYLALLIILGIHWTKHQVEFISYDFHASRIFLLIYLVILDFYPFAEEFSQAGDRLPGLPNGPGIGIPRFGSRLGPPRRPRPAARLLDCFAGCRIRIHQYLAKRKVFYWINFEHPSIWFFLTVKIFILLLDFCVKLNLKNILYIQI